MKQYIDKSALVAEIEHLRENQRLDDRHGQGVLDGLHAIEKFLNDLEVKKVEEPVINVWHDANEEQPEEYRTVVVWNPITMDGEVLTRCVEVYKGRIWAYIEDILKLSIVERNRKDCKEEPVSDDFEEACNQMSKAARISKCEAGKPFFSDEDYKLGFKDGANWQKQKDDEMLTKERR